MKSRNRRLNTRINGIAAAVCLILLATMALAALSCGSGEAQQPEEQPVSQEENAQSLGQIMGYRNQVEGELNEPVDAVITGEVTRSADAGEEIFLMLRVSDLRCLSVPQDTLKVSPGSEVSIRLRKDEDSGSITQGEFLEIDARIAKSAEGPVIIGRAFRKI